LSIDECSTLGGFENPGKSAVSEKAAETEVTAEKISIVEARLRPLEEAQIVQYQAGFVIRR
jgi:hypothetical protein